MHRWKRTRKAESVDTNTPEPDVLNLRGFTDALAADEPISGRAHDSLSRVAFADAVAAGIATGPRAAGFVAGLLGPWGSGKSSILNMVEEALVQRSDTMVLRFNPWLFSGSEQLTGQFFREIGAQLIETRDPKLKKVGEKLLGYGEALTAFALIPVIGHALAILGAIAKAGRGMKERNPKPGPSLEQQRDRLQAAIRELDQRLVIVIDDIDRLDHQEIRDVMRLVRVTAHFQNIVYLLAFDRAKVEQALAQGYNGNQGDGQAYLEKILQATYNIPEIRGSDLQRILLQELDQVISASPHGPISSTDLTNIVHLVILPMFQSIRGIRRYINALPAVLEVIGQEVALADVLALEAVRVLVPNAFALLAAAAEALSDARLAQSSLGDPQASETRARDRFLALVLAEPEQALPLTEFCTRLFPQSQRFFGRGNIVYPGEWYNRWRRQRRVAHPEVFRFFLEKSLPSNTLRARTVQEIFEALRDPAALALLLDSLEADRLLEALRRLEDYEDEFPVENVAGAMRVLMNQLSRLPQGNSAADPVPPPLQLARVVLRLLRRIADEGARLAAAYASS